MPNKTVNIADIGEVKIYKKKGNRNIRMSIARDGSVRISLPYWLPYSAGTEFAKARTEWINNNKPNELPLLSENMKIGKAHRLIFIPAETTKPSVRIIDNKVRVTYPSILDISNTDVQSTANRGAIKALKTEANQLLPQRLDQIANKYNFEYSSVETKRLVSRWGSCTHKKQITLNIYLMQLPWQLIDYVIMHELVHTEHLNHGSGFWQRFEQIQPDAKQLRKQLKLHSTIVTPTKVD
jgi:predicted metal-dependent hydrolase